SQHTVEENRRIWNDYDWAEGGEEWTHAVEGYKGLDPDLWKRSIVENMMLKYLDAGMTILEVGPGAGRWTATLQEFAGRLLLADISTKCLDVCRQRFPDRPNISFHPIGETGLSFLDAESGDGVWSYAVFVHINPTTIAGYVRDFL